MLKYYCVVDDAITYYTDRVNKLMVLSDYAERLYKRHPALEKQFKRVLRPCVELERKLNESIKGTAPDAEVFFKLDHTVNGEKHRLLNPAWMLLGSFAGLEEQPTLETIIARLRRMSQCERDILFINYLRDLEAEEATKELYYDITEDNCGNLFTVLRGCALEQFTRGRLIDLYANFDEYVDRLETIIRPAVDIIIENAELYEESVKKCAETIDECGGISGYMLKRHKYAMSVGGAHRAHLCVLMPYSISLRDGIIENLDTYIGVGIDEIIALRNSSRENLKLSNMFKMLSDETRLEILQAICKRAMYGLEIAEQFNISASTVSYHMRKLNRGGFTESYFDSGKTYYRANRDGIRHFIKDIEEYLSNQ